MGLEGMLWVIPTPAFLRQQCRILFLLKYKMRFSFSIQHGGKPLILYLSMGQASSYCASGGARGLMWLAGAQHGEGVCGVGGSTGERVEGGLWGEG